MLTREAPASERAPVLSHNDVNPTNIVYDGENILLLDWDTAGMNDPFYDLAVASVFFRMDDDTCRALLSAYDGEPVADLPARFLHSRRMAATLGGTMFLHLARQSGHAGATGDETLENTLSLGDCFQQMRAGTLSVGSADGQWTFGLALIKEGQAL
jgi:Ser/Thr protein kinase RdoA (MazF antagonist)